MNPRIRTIAGMLAGLFLAACAVFPTVSGESPDTILIKGSVTTMDGKPAAGVEVSARTQTGDAWTTKTVDTLADGSYSVPIKRGDVLKISYLSVEGMNFVSDLSGNADQNIHVRLRHPNHQASAGRFDVGAFTEQAAALKAMYLFIYGDSGDRDDVGVIAQLDKNADGLLELAELANSEKKTRDKDTTDLKKVIDAEVGSLKAVKRAAKKKVKSR